MRTVLLVVCMVIGPFLIITGVVQLVTWKTGQPASVFVPRAAPTATEKAPRSPWSYELEGRAASACEAVPNLEKLSPVVRDVALKNCRYGFWVGVKYGMEMRR